MLALVCEAEEKENRSEYLFAGMRVIECIAESHIVCVCVCVCVCVFGGGCGGCATAWLCACTDVTGRRACVH